ncbi:MAG: hypothetical protein ABFD89_29455 [Bryobacteraceae bacterium]
MGECKCATLSAQLCAARAALEKARHELASTNGLTAYDSATPESRAVEQHFQVDHAETIAAIDAWLNATSIRCPHEERVKGLARAVRLGIGEQVALAVRLGMVFAKASRQLAEPRDHLNDQRVLTDIATMAEVSGYKKAVASVPEGIRGVWTVEVRVDPPTWALCRNGEAVFELHDQRPERADGIADVLNRAQQSGDGA